MIISLIISWFRHIYDIELMDSWLNSVNGIWPDIELISALSKVLEKVIIVIEKGIIEKFLFVANFALE